ncbi:MAG: hypothetical protein IT538_14255, partial [Variibacter sp.]|nr:hypothetical protein [Variibacter sp.]
MTKLDPAGEPSMDEILASIRRIIAEEPPGSRAQPEPQAAARKEPAPQQQPDVTAALETKSATAQRTEPSFGTSAFGPSIFAAAPARQEDTLPRLSPTGKREVEAIPMAGAEPEIGTQLADVLGAVRSAMSDGAKNDSGRTEPAFSAPQSAPAPGATPATNVQAAIDSLIAPKPEPGFAQPSALPARPGFTVSRDGFIPPAEKAAPEPPAADPFEFSLGPSPFARQSMAEPAPAAPAPSTNEAFGSLIPSRDMLTIDRSTLSEPAASSAQAPVAPATPMAAAFAPSPSAAPAPAPVRLQPDFSAMKSAPAPKPAAEPPFAARGAADLAPAPAAPPSFVAPAPAAFVPAAAAPQPAPATESPRVVADARTMTRSSPSFGEIATPSTDVPAWPPAAETKPAAPAFAPPPAAAVRAAVSTAAPGFITPAPAGTTQKPAAPAPAFTATMFEAPVSAVVAPQGMAPAPAAPTAAPSAAPSPAVPVTSAALPQVHIAPQSVAAPPNTFGQPPIQTSHQPDPAAALLEQLARTSAVAPPPQAAPFAEAMTAPAPAAAPAAPVEDEPAIEHVEATIEPAAAADQPAEQDADFED